MGYDIYITRRAHWSDEGGPEILLSDWLSYLSIDPSLRKDPQAGDGAGYDEEHKHVIWTEWPAQGNGKEARFHLEGGNVVATATDDSMRQKLFIIAHVLEAKVQGRKGEIYDSVGRPEKKRRRSKEPNVEKSWWQFWSIVLAVTLLCAAHPAVADRIDAGQGMMAEALR